MEELPITLHDARTLVIGAGRPGKVLIQQLKGLGANVTLAAKAHPRNARPLILAVSTDDAMGGALDNRPHSLYYTGIKSHCGRQGKEEELIP